MASFNGSIWSPVVDVVDCIKVQRCCSPKTKTLIGTGSYMQFYIPPLLIQISSEHFYNVCTSLSGSAHTQLG